MQRTFHPWSQGWSHLTQRVLTLLLSGVLLAACTTVQPVPNPLSPAAPPPMAVRHFVADWDGSGAYQVSPDGRRLLWVARQGFGPGLFVKDLDTGAVRRYPVPVPGIWARDSRHVLLHLNAGGNELEHVIELDATLDPQSSSAQTPLFRDLTPFPGAKSFVHALLEDSDDLLISSNRRDPKVFDLYRYRRVPVPQGSTSSQGELQLLATNPGDVAQWLTSPQGEVLGRAVKREARWAVQTPGATPEAPWQTRFEVDLLDTVSLLGPTADPRQFWALSNRGRDRLALVRIDLDSGAETVVWSDPQFDVDGPVLLNPKRHELEALALEADRPRWQTFTPEIATVMQRLQGDHASPDQRITLMSRSDDQRVIVAAVTHPQGGEFVLYQRDTDTRTVLATTTRSRLHDRQPLGSQQPVQFTSRDGLTLHGYLTLPAHVAADRSGDTPAAALPTVVYVHGGPWGRDVYLNADLMPWFLADRGYAVLQLNYRGSTGYGRTFRDAARGEFAGRMHTDLLDAVDGLIRQGVTDPRRVAIMGGSYGGYASLVGMSFTPERFACGISVVGMSDLVSLLEEFPAYWEFGKPMWQAFVGDVSQAADRERLRAQSPLYRADKVQGPVLLLHGVNDPRVRVSQSVRMADALRAAGKPVQLHLFNNAGHGFQHWPEQLRYYRLTEDFLAGCLGGRAAGFDVFELGAWLF